MKLFSYVVNYQSCMQQQIVYDFVHAKNSSAIFWSWFPRHVKIGKYRVDTLQWYTMEILHRHCIVFRWLDDFSRISTE